MQTVLDHIEERRETFRQAPFFQFLHSPQDDPVRTLGFVKHAAYFIMAFADLNHYALRSLGPNDRWQARQAVEDTHHWPWFLDDLAALGLDDIQPFSETLRFLWSEDNRAARLLPYRLWSMAERADPLERVVIIEAIEAAGEVFCRAMAEIADRIPPVPLGQKLHYVAETRHFAVEHDADGSHEEALHGGNDVTLEVDPALRARHLALVSEVFDHFTALVDELHVHARRIAA